MLLETIFAVVTLTVGAIASPVQHLSSHVLHERRHVPHPAFIKRSHVPVGRSLPVRIGLTQRNLDIGHDLLMEVSTPGSPKYGQHYSAEDIIEIFKPSDDTVAAVSRWLEDAGITHFSQSANKQWMQFDARVEILEELVKAKYHEYEHLETGAIHVACDEYHVPVHIQEHIDYITPGIKLVSTRASDVVGGNAALKKRANDFRITHSDTAVDTSTLVTSPANPLSSCSEVMTPYCIMVMYNITQGTTAVAGNELGLYEGDDQTFAQSTLNLFFKGFAPYIPKGTKPTISGIDGGDEVYPVNATEAGYSETDLDLESAYSLIYPQGIIIFQTDDKHYEINGTYPGFLNNLFDAIDGSVSL